jgi:hypothetical protein
LERGLKEVSRGSVGLGLAKKSAIAETTPVIAITAFKMLHAAC